jgi:hypothetical protein
MFGTMLCWILDNHTGDCCRSLSLIPAHINSILSRMLGICLEIRAKISANSRRMIDTLMNKMLNKFRENWLSSFRNQMHKVEKCENLTFDRRAGTDETIS